MGEGAEVRGETEGLTRRGLLAGAVAAAAVAPSIFGAGSASAQVPGWRAVDVHHHLAPPRWINDVIIARKTGQRPLADWTAARSIEDMDRGGVARAITSISEPGVHFGDAAVARALARECNEYAARLMADHPGRFGMFAILPLPDVDGALAEIAYALDTLKADGICLLTSYQSKYLGDPAFAPVMDELNRRKAVVYTHPVRADCCRNLVADVPEPVIELGTDTTRTIASVMFSGTAARCPDIRFIWSHAGGTAPFLADRLNRWSNARPEFKAKLPDGAIGAMQKFYYDTAAAAHPHALSSLMQLVKVSQVLLGTDFPFSTSAANHKGLAGFGFSEADLSAIGRGNATRLGLIKG